MIVSIQGKKYNFEIVAVDDCFYIKAKHKFTGRFSCINNLNTILSALKANVDDEKFGDSFWILSKNKVRKFEKVAREILSHKEFRDYLEEKLDEDRECGEWENIEK